MRLNKLFILFCIILLSITGCVTKKKCDAKFPPMIIMKDSIVYRDSIVEKEKIITLPGDTSTAKALLECDSLGKVRISYLENQLGKISRINISLRDGVLVSKCIVDSQAVAIKWNEHHKIKEATHKETQVHTVTTTVYPWYLKPLIYWFFLSLVYIILKLIAKVYFPGLNKFL